MTTAWAQLAPEFTALCHDYPKLAKQDALRHQAKRPDRDLAYLEEGSCYFGDCVRAVGWAQRFAAINREVMMKRVIEAANTLVYKRFQRHIAAVNCHHNYVSREHHFGEDVYVTRKGAVSAKAGQLGIIPGSMGWPSTGSRGGGRHAGARGSTRVNTTPSSTLRALTVPPILAM